MAQQSRNRPVPNGAPGPRLPYGLMSKRLLDESGLDYDDRLLTSREEVDAFEAKHDVATTPQTFVNGERIGGTEELANFLERAEAQG